MSRVRPVLALAAFLGATPLAYAQVAVIDVASLTQLISEVQTLEQQVATARSQLAQAQSEYQSITGVRGMGQLLSGITRNYLPADWLALQSAVHGSGGYPALAADLQALLKTAAVLSGSQMAILSPVVAAQLQSGRQSVALLQGLSHAALANASDRFAEIQQLIDAIAAAVDQKAILELQTRIAAEQGMLQNEQTKLQVLHQAMQAQQQANAQQIHELAIAGHGQFANRLQPHP